MVVTIMAHMCNLTPRLARRKTISICKAITQFIVRPTTHTLTPHKKIYKKHAVKRSEANLVRRQQGQEVCNMQHAAFGKQKVKRLL